MKNIDYWSKLLKNPSVSYKKWFEDEENYLVENITKEAKVLDIGCGNGRILNVLIKITKNLIGIDNEEKAVEDAKDNLKNYSTIKILLVDAKNLPFNDNSFDFVVCLATFVNFGDDKVNALLEMKRVVKKDGFIIIDAFSEDAFDERMKVYKKYKAPIKEIKENKITFDDTGVSEQFSREQLIDVFNQAKLKIIEIKKLNMAYICKLRK